MRFLRRKRDDESNFAEPAPSTEYDIDSADEIEEAQPDEVGRLL